MAVCTKSDIPQSVERAPIDVILNFHPYHFPTTNMLSTSGGTISQGSYATQLLKKGYSNVYIKFEPLKFDMWVKPEINFRLWKFLTNLFSKKP